MATSLSCGDYEVYLAERGGTSLVCRLTGTESISFNRVLNDFSEARISVALNSECRDCLSTANPWQHEILIFRATKLVWCGPLISLTYQPSSSRVQLYARDLMAWTEKRFIEIFGPDDFDVEEADVAAVFAWVLNHGYEKDPWNMSWSLSPTGIPITKFYPSAGTDKWGGLYANVGTELRSLADVGVDYTVLNRTLYGGDLVVRPPTPITIKFTNQSWLVSPEIVIDGARMSTRTAVGGGSGGYYGYYEDQMWIEETPGLPWGLLETFTQRSDLSDADTTELPNPVTQEAYARHQLLRTPIAYITGGQLAGDAMFDFNDLIPGIPIQIALLDSVRELTNNYRLFGVQVAVSKDAEKININISAPGAEELRT